MNNQGIYMDQFARERYSVDSSDADSAATVLARAFANDPLWHYLVPETTQRLLALRQSFRATVPYYSRQKIVWGIGTPLAGVAIWVPPHPLARPWRAFLNINTATLLFSPLLYVFGRAIPIFTQFDRMHKQYVTQPHYYLATIGVVPQAQGRGYASRLLQPVLRQADAQRMGAYTETMTPSNVPLYQHYGFIIQEQYDVPATDLSIWSFYRPPSDKYYDV